MKSILFVCTGNTCRSPMAEALFKKMTDRRNDIKIHSAGIQTMDGLPASSNAIKIMAKQGANLSSFQSHSVTASLIGQADFIFAMTHHHERALLQLYPEAKKKIFLLTKWSSEKDIDDPIVGTIEDYQACSEKIKIALQKILAFIDKQLWDNYNSSMDTTSHPHQQKLIALKKTDPHIAAAIEAEQARQYDHIELIASENFTSQTVMEAQGSCLTNKYAEGYPSRRWYGGCEHVDVVEMLAIKRALELFGGEHVNVQPHSGSQANMAVYFSALQSGDTILTMDLAHGGHLTHGHRANFSGKMYTVHHYGVSENDGQIDYDALAKQAEQVKPKMITAGASAYSRIIDFERLRGIADSVGALLFVDMAHIAGLVAGGMHPSPVPFADFVTTTTHKSLRGPRGGLIICKEKHAKKLDSQVFPGVQGGPLMHVIAAKAVCLHEALQPGFRDYARQVVLNAKALAARLTVLGYTIVSGGTDNHLMLVDLRPRGINGLEAQEILDRVAITANKNALPFDTEQITKTGGIRLGSPAMTTRGLREEEMMQVADFIHEGLENRSDEELLTRLCGEVKKFAKSFPLPA
ncbi:MAG: serine hydroxymethyltransferase [Chthoniobacterales bacterium]